MGNSTPLRKDGLVRLNVWWQRWRNSWFTLAILCAAILSTIFARGVYVDRRPQLTHEAQVLWQRLTRPSRSDRVQLNIPRTDLYTALSELGTQAKISWYAPCAAIRNVMTGPLVGSFAIDEAAAELLKPSGLSFEFLRTERALVLRVSLDQKCH